MDMYICAPWGNYELELVSKSTNGGNAMEKIAWEVEYGPDEVSGVCSSFTLTVRDRACLRSPVLL